MLDTFDYSSKKRPRVLASTAGSRASSGVAAAAAADDMMVATGMVAAPAAAVGRGRRITRTCQHDDCGKNPYFGWHGERAIYCVAHKEQGKKRICGCWLGSLQLLLIAHTQHSTVL